MSVPLPGPMSVPLPGPMRAPVSGPMSARMPGWELALTGGLFLAKLLIVLWGMNRGLDPGDGGFFLLNLNHPAGAPPLFEFYRLLLFFDPPLRFGVLGARLLRLAVELAGTLVLVHGVYRWTRTRLPGAFAAGFPWLFFFTGMGTLLSVAAREFGYNDLTNLLIFSACACMFRLLAVPSGPVAQRRRMLWSAGAGLLLGLQLFVKFPATLLLLGLFVLLVLFVLRASALQRGAVLLAALCGSAAAVALFAAASGGLAPLLAKWEFASEVNRVTGYGIGEILQVYVRLDRPAHVAGARFALALAVCFGIAYRSLGRRPGGKDASLTAALLVAATVLLCGAFTFHAPNIHPWLLALFGCTLVLGLVFWLLAWRNLPSQAAPPAADRFTALMPLGLLAALPFVAMAGTNVPFTLRLPTHVAPLFLLVGVLTPALREAGYRWFSAASLVLLAVVSSLVFYAHHVERPYGLAAPLYRQTHEVADLPGIRVDPATAAFLSALREAVDRGGYRAGDPVIAFDFMPGLVHYLGARSPGFPFFPFDRPEQNCWAINRAEGGEVPFLILGQSMTLEQHDCIRAFSFPEQFEELATLPNPYEYAIPYFFGGPPMPYVKIFGPRARLR